MSFAPPDTTTVAIAGDVHFRLVLPTTSTDPVVAAYLEGEPLNAYLVDVLKRLVPEPVTVLDLGCHVGTFAMAAAALGHRVIAIDASPLHVELVRRSAAENGFADVTVIHAAVSDQPGRVHFHENGLFGSVVAAAPGAIEVEADAVPALLARAGVDLADVAFVKADVEGSELRAFAGMAQHLARPGAPPIVYESNPLTSTAFGFSVDGIRTALEVLGYRNYRREPDGLFDCPPLEPQPEGWVDLLALKPEHVDAMQLSPGPWPREALIARFEGWGALPHVNVRTYVAETLLANWATLGDDDRVVRLVERLAEDEDALVRDAVARGRPSEAPAADPPAAPTAAAGNPVATWLRRLRS